MNIRKKSMRFASLFLAMVMFFGMAGIQASAQSPGVLRINGQVKDLNGNAVSNVNVTFNYGTSSASQLTCSQGLFTFVMWSGVTGTLTFEKKDYTIYPASYEITESYQGESIGITTIPDSVDVSKLIIEVGSAECTVPAGTTPAQLKQLAPKTVELRFMDGGSGTIEVPWMVPTIVPEFNPDLNKPGTYLARAKVYYDDEGYTALDKLKDGKGIVYCYLTINVI